MGDSEFLKHLSLPGRFEQLKSESIKTGSDIAGIIQPVDKSCQEIETILREINTSGLGRLLVFHGNSGSGKSTFLYGLKYFFENIFITSFPQESSISELSEFIKKDSPIVSTHRLYIIDNRDNPNETEEDIKVAFESLRNLFRTEAGKILIVWPITDLKAATSIADIAWHIGRDSLLGTRTRVYNFVGLPKESFAVVADITTRALNAGENLESFGIDISTSNEIARMSETIGEFYSRLNGFSAERNSNTYSLLKTRIRPRVWIVVPGDDSKELDRTISSLTQGTRNRIDIDKIAEFLDKKDNESAYLHDWRARRTDMAYLMRILDVRLFELLPNAALASVRCFGSEKAKGELKKRNETQENCSEALSRARVCQAIINPEESLSIRIRETAQEMANEYMVIQQLAAKGDNSLNLAVSEAIKSFLLQQTGNSVDVVCEKQNLPNSQLCPDIQIPFRDGSIICLELTWRSTGKSITGTGSRKPQNTLSPGHIMKYLLDKAMEYVKDLNL
jgi:hypothetical protein